jgi:hypothetical protein
MQKSKILLLGAMLAANVLLANAAITPVTPSTNDGNRTNGWAHFNVVATNPGVVVIEFNNPRSFASCFEYRIDGVAPGAASNYNPAVTDGMWPFVCKNNSTEQRTFIVTSSLEIRMVFGAETDERFDWTSVEVIPPPPSYACSGFQAPMDKPVVVKKAGRVLPLRMNLQDSSGAIMSAITPPVIQVSYLGSYEYEDGALDELNFAGQGSEGNVYVWNGEYWAFNMVTKGLAPGTYTITAVSGDAGEYLIHPTCSASVQIE